MMRRKFSLWLKLSRKGVVYVFLLIMVGFCLFPLYIVINTSLKDQVEIFMNFLALPRNPRFYHYVTVWIQSHFNRFFLNSVIISLPTAVIATSVSLLAAYPFANLRFKGNKALFLVFLAGIMVSPISLIIPSYINLRFLRLLNSYFGVMFPLTAMGIPFGVFLLTIHCQSIPKELMDAGRIDGCGEAAILLNIFLPLMSPGLKAVFVVELLWAWNSYIIPLVLLQDHNLMPLTVGLDLFSGRYGTEYPLIATGATIAFVPMIILFLITQKSFKRGITTGALK